ncbi:hypothetical protein BATDEDRAFT_22770 [Batrachochytrium dendrobatidis JAM81]|uniref:Uncharacterized protein n=2 Tax=Batrachochytrium dendrobatidis TaxID=109871 RepID=F4NXI3_BATDJ|nr:uncharacterized protein BATDEDRAFT_22770 [Batrachochytrium dendrobatidis JAM81]EGF82688.1 hypothetical protein BATDEDRAFT_22770 [Batrachochytrium dendrobatidis JAM81]KAJ8328349.1 hypothetical protein O5D80_003707 [Batrachochytrium dendrobatidis]KAK5673409.1 hypothetical protein QVD99_000858 [Batrachochytrium dendrobatidis]OAJ39870.1 hypothetical protein BDEG_23674 [Batrachochytrium dendrobatidis JEL423]|eukprot:XP_006676619.1 hypothetical protein BATDEDRAFT_22770 [Batrachochytrium dendrobatidis JAM81]
MSSLVSDMLSVFDERLEILHSESMQQIHKVSAASKFVAQSRRIRQSEELRDQSHYRVTRSYATANGCLCNCEAARSICNHSSANGCAISANNSALGPESILNGKHLGAARHSTALSCCPQPEGGWTPSNQPCLFTSCLQIAITLPGHYRKPRTLGALRKSIPAKTSFYSQ